MTLLREAPSRPTGVPTPRLISPEPRLVPQEFLLTTGVFDTPEPKAWPPHSHVEHELMWSQRGVLTVLIDDRLWTLSPGVGLWIPGGVAHEARTDGRAMLCATYVSPEAWAPEWNGVTTVRVNGAVQHLLTHLTKSPMPDEERRRAQQVCMDLIEPLGEREVSVPIPRDARLRALVRGVLEDPADDRSLEQWAAHLNLSPRTVTRAFAAEVTMGFAQWRRVVRMHVAYGLLADGMTVTSAGRRVGYGTPSAFVAAFRRVMGHTPGEVKPVG